jgi:hypothetical protein
MKQLNKELAAEARAKGICKEWYSRLQRTEDRETLLKMFLDGIDFCISEDFPSPRFFQLFDGIRQQHGIFRDEPIKAENSRYVAAFGRSEGTAQYAGYAVGQVFVKHESKLTINATGNAFVMVDIFDSAAIEVNASGAAKVCVNQYGGQVTSTEREQATIKVIHKHSKTY